MHDFAKDQDLNHLGGEILHSIEGRVKKKLIYQNSSDSLAFLNTFFVSFLRVCLSLSPKFMKCATAHRSNVSHCCEPIISLT
jgi:hypothetical protein